jgi:hypothetical protein
MIQALPISECSFQTLPPITETIIHLFIFFMKIKMGKMIVCTSYMYIIYVAFIAPTYVDKRLNVDVESVRYDILGRR